MLARPEPAFLVARRGTLRAPAPKKQLTLLSQTLPPRLWLPISLNHFVLVARRDITGLKTADRDSIKTEPCWVLTNTRETGWGANAGPDNEWDNNNYNNNEPVHTLRPITELVRATPGSAGLDLSSTTSTLLTTDSPTIKIPTGIKGPLPTDLVGIILGRRSLSCARTYYYSWSNWFRLYRRNSNNDFSPN